MQILAEEGLTVIVPTEDYVVGQTTYKWGATNPATESTNAQAILDFKMGAVITAHIHLFPTFQEMLQQPQNSKHRGK